MDIREFALRKTGRGTRKISLDRSQAERPRSLRAYRYDLAGHQGYLQWSMLLGPTSVPKDDPQTFGK
jgi:hypothetical protein